MDAQRGTDGDLHGEDRRWRPIVLGLLAANGVALVALAFVTLTGEDRTGAASTVPVAAASTDADTRTGPAAVAAAARPRSTAEPTTAEGADPADGGAADEMAPAEQAEGEGDAATAPALEDVARLDVSLTPPAGFVPLQGETLTRSAGPFDLAVEFDPLHPSYPRSRLAELELQATGTSAWQSPTDTLVVSAYEFPDSATAATFVDEAAAPWRSEPEVMPHDMRGVPGSRAFHQMGRGDQSQFALVARGTRVWVVGLAGAAAADHSMELVHQAMHQVGA